MEEWKKIPNYPLYECSNMGFIKTFNWKNKGVERIMNPALDRAGYLRTMLKGEDGKFHTIKIHRIIAQTFISNPYNKPQINHINCIKNDNRVSNLEWATNSENIKHAYKQNRMTNKGECNPAALLTDKQVIEIRSKYTYGRFGGKPKQGEVSKPDLAKEYNVSIWVIKEIVTGRTWKHLL
jgi:hypothetical protein